MTHTNPLSKEDTSKKNNAFRIVAAILGGSLVGLVFNTIIAIQVNTWQVYGILVPVIILSVLAFNSLRLIRNGKIERGMWQIIVGMLIILPPFVLLISGLGIILSLIIVMTTYFYARQTLPAKDVKRILVASLSVGALTAATDFLTLEYRLQVPAIQAFAPAITVITLLFIGFFVARQAWGRSLRNKLLIAFAGVTLVAAGALAVYVFTSTSTLLQQGLERELSESTTKIAVRVGDLFNEQINILTALSLNEVLKGGVETQNNSYVENANAIQAKLDANDERWRAAVEADDNNDFLVQWHLTNAVAQELVEFQTIFPANVEVFVTDVYGGLAGTTNRTSDYYQADEAWWQAAYNNGQGAVYISEPEFDESADALAVLIAMPLRNYESGEIVGILRTTYLASALGEIIEESVGGTGETDLYIPGEVVSHFHGGQYTPVEQGEYEKLQAVAGQGMVEMDYEGIPSVVIQAPVRALENNPAVDSLGWVVVFHQQQEDAFAPVNAQIRGVFIVMAVVVALAVGAAFILSVYLVRPIIQLNQTAEEVSAGNLSSRAEVTTTDEIGTLASTFNNMTAQLQDTLESLEQRVANRTKALATSAEVTRRLATILDPGQLVGEVVNEVRNAFDYYYAQIYLLDEAGDNLVIAGGTGEAGASMLASGHSLPKGRGLVGRAADANASVLVPDVSQEEGWLPNELLPETKSEAAIPISVGNQVFGVLDVQHSMVNGLTAEDVTLLESLAGQVAISLQNARSYEQSRKQAELESLVNVIGQRIQRTTTIEDTLQTAIRELGTAIGATRVRASIRAASDTATPIEPAKPFTAEADRKNGSSNPDSTLVE